ncbi:UNVERIFIED_CONTAM: hypothetical protein HDU68_000701, partial [Siphonaria sp. JEL0065]
MDESWEKDVDAEDDAIRSNRNVLLDDEDEEDEEDAMYRALASGERIVNGSASLGLKALSPSIGSTVPGVPSAVKQQALNTKQNINNTNPSSVASSTTTSQEYLNSFLNSSSEDKGGTRFASDPQIKDMQQQDEQRRQPQQQVQQQRPRKTSVSELISTFEVSSSTGNTDTSRSPNSRNGSVILSGATPRVSSSQSQQLQPQQPQQQHLQPPPPSAQKQRAFFTSSSFSSLQQPQQLQPPSPNRRVSSTSSSVSSLQPKQQKRLEKPNRGIPPNSATGGSTRTFGNTGLTPPPPTAISKSSSFSVVADAAASAANIPPGSPIAQIVSKFESAADSRRRESATSLAGNISTGRGNSRRGSVNVSGGGNGSVGHSLGEFSEDDVGDGSHVGLQKHQQQQVRPAVSATKLKIATARKQRDVLTIDHISPTTPSVPQFHASNNSIDGFMDSVGGGGGGGGDVGVGRDEDVGFIDDYGDSRRVLGNQQQQQSGQRLLGVAGSLDGSGVSLAGFLGLDDSSSQMDIRGGKSRSGSLFGSSQPVGGPVGGVEGLTESEEYLSRFLAGGGLENQEERGPMMSGIASSPVSPGTTGIAGGATRKGVSFSRDVLLEDESGFFGLPQQQQQQKSHPMKPVLKRKNVVPENGVPGGVVGTTPTTAGQVSFSQEFGDSFRDLMATKNDDYGQQQKHPALKKNGSASARTSDLGSLNSFLMKYASIPKQQQHEQQQYLQPLGSPQRSENGAWTKRHSAPNALIAALVQKTQRSSGGNMEVHQQSPSRASYSFGESGNVISAMNQPIVGTAEPAARVSSYGLTAASRERLGTLFSQDGLAAANKVGGSGELYSLVANSGSSLRGNMTGRNSVAGNDGQTLDNAAATLRATESVSNSGSTDKRQFGDEGCFFLHCTSLMTTPSQRQPLNDIPRGALRKAIINKSRQSSVFRDRGSRHGSGGLASSIDGRHEFTGYNDEGSSSSELYECGDDEEDYGLEEQEYDDKEQEQEASESFTESEDYFEGYEELQRTRQPARQRMPFMKKREPISFRPSEATLKKRHHELDIVNAELVQLSKILGNKRGELRQREKALDSREEIIMRAQEQIEVEVQELLCKRTRARDDFLKKEVEALIYESDASVSALAKENRRLVSSNKELAVANRRLRDQAKLMMEGIDERDVRELESHNQIKQLKDRIERLKKNMSNMKTSNLVIQRQKQPPTFGVGHDHNHSTNRGNQVNGLILAFKYHSVPDVVPIAFAQTIPIPANTRETKEVPATNSDLLFVLLRTHLMLQQADMHDSCNINIQKIINTKLQQNANEIVQPLAQNIINLAKHSLDSEQSSGMYSLFLTFVLSFVRALAPQSHE